MALFTELFAWWTGNTIGTRLWTWRYGKKVGTDEDGNTYYQDKTGERRWVVYKKGWEATQVPAAWHGWMHHVVDVPPTEEDYHAKPWQKPSRPNMTGTPEAYHPPGSTLRPLDEPRPATRAYEPWQPS
ncbi:NADH:ubiquinone oxidoreductase subunit NDUFA12 [Methyloligella sp. 2.7D]|uniref:NADH:ubiquinone oxidoreductase subunit NDUFA12 n=1 Tax=unclassified Methyloligella TaxID=2625955 RepID=UPI00157C242E|nr:NADH:ubiquinone oxidoreductase subunit NDUFA12 [Methyloligella sp. GL2]QKP77819.1 NADH:ubiquinone oxidoreductase subunit NDUFA12 [Methyloligella sp. GL2]